MKKKYIGIIILIIIILSIIGIYVYIKYQNRMIYVNKEYKGPSTRTLKSYRIESPDEDSGLSNGNSASLEGQLSYGAMYLPQRHDDWEKRVMREYVVDYIPNKAGCKVPAKYKDQYNCPPFGNYTKCNPAGCAGNTNCEIDDDCPGQGGKCIKGSCVCCQQGNDCESDEWCGTGKCVKGKCDCSKIDMEYKCNVNMYPPRTSTIGYMDGVGAVKAPVDKSPYEKDDWIPKGWWYSFPRKNECKKDQKLGDNGCTWKVKSSDKSFSLSELADKGFKFYCKKGDYCSPKKDVSGYQKKNLEILKKAFDIHTNDGEKGQHALYKSNAIDIAHEEAGINKYNMFG